MERQESQESKKATICECEIVCLMCLARCQYSCDCGVRLKELKCENCSRVGYMIKTGD